MNLLNRAMDFVGGETGGLEAAEFHR
jgi:hypothetical protein